MPAGARPSGARLRESLLSIWGERVVGAAIADLFAGSGAVGIEALSRGAARALFVESRPIALRTLTRNVEQLGLESRCDIRRAELPAGLARVARDWRGAVDLVFVDPPYRQKELAAVVSAAASLLSADGVLTLEHARRVTPPLAGGLALVDRRIYGDSALAFYRRAGASGETG